MSLIQSISLRAILSLAICIALVLSGVVTHPAFAGPKEEAEAAVAWEIAIRAKHPAKNDQTAAVKPNTTPAAKPKAVKREECHTDIATATRTAERENRAVVLWIGMQCEDDVRTREALNECVHVHLDTNGGSVTPRIEIPKGNGRSWVIEKDRLPTYSTTLLRELANDGKPSASRSVLGGRVIRGANGNECVNGVCPDGTICGDGSCVSSCPGGNCSTGSFSSFSSPPRAYSPSPVYLPASLPVLGGSNCPGGNCPRR